VLGTSMAFKTIIKCGRNGEMCMYFVYGFNEKWLTDLSFFPMLCFYSINKCGR
jgi:hypothetical protein